jgi:hypothetical protein
MLEGTQYWWTTLINGFVGAWVYGQGWYSPLYYGALFGVAYLIRDRMQWREGILPVFFVLGISLAHGASVALLVFFFMTASGGWFFGIPGIVAAIYGLKRVVGSLRHTANSRTQLAKLSLVKGASSLVLALVMVMVYAYSVAG